MTRSAVLVAAMAAMYLVVLPMATLGVVLFAASQDTTGCRAGGGPGGGGQQIDGQQWSPEQMDNAETITQTAAARRLPRRAAVIAIAAAITESTLKNVPHGDRDSVGLFQERPSAGWGTPEDILNPVYATNKFFDHLLAISGWPSMPVGQAAQAVEVSAFPDRYSSHESAATKLVDRFWSGPDNPVPAPAGGGGPPPVQQLAHATTGCPDQGGSNLPIDPQHPCQLPPGFALPIDGRQRAAVEFALGQCGKPYVWGAKGPDAFDCSGLVQAAWAHAGVSIPAGTYAEAKSGDAVVGMDELQPGDLLFIPGSDGTAANPGHVGMYIGQGLIVNAYDEKTGIVVDSIDHWRGQVVAIRRPAPPQPHDLVSGTQS